MTNSHSPSSAGSVEAILRRALDDIEVEDGKCRWADVASILPYVRGELRTFTDAQAVGVRLEARLANNSNDWTEIFPSQLEWVAKAGHQVRAIELAAKPPAAPVELRCSECGATDDVGILCQRCRKPLSHSSAGNVHLDELPDELNPPAIDQLFARDDLYTARAVFARLRNFGYAVTRNEPQGVPETFRLDATNRVLRKALKHIAGQRWNEKETVQHICDYAENILEREDAANKPQQVEVSITELRQTVEDAIRTFCQSLGVGAVTISSDGVERIYYAGINLKALSVAVTLALPRPYLAGDK